MSKVVLSGYYGFNNAGDEAILFAMIQTFKKIDPTIEVTVLSKDPEKTARQYSVKAVNRWRPIAVIRALSSSNLLISGGGSLLQDVTGAKSPLYYLGVIGLAKLLGKPVMIYAQGIGPLRRKVNRKLTAWTFNKANSITVRDEKSKADLEAMGVRKAVTVTADPVLAVKIEEIGSEPGTKILEQAGLAVKGERPLLGVFVRSWQDNRYLPELAWACDRLTEEGWRVVFVPMQFPDDINISKQVVKTMTHEAVYLKGLYSPQEILSIIASLDMLVGMRLHSLIGAVVAGVPVVGVSYDPKIERFLEQIGQHALVTVNEFNARTFIEMVNCAYERRNEDLEDRKRQLGTMYQKAWQTARIACGLLDAAVKTAGRTKGSKIT